MLKPYIPEVQYRLRPAHKQHPARFKRGKKAAIQPVFRFFGKIDDNIPAQNKIKP